MISANEMRSITNSSKEKYASELKRIENEMVKRAQAGFTSHSTTAPIEISQEIRDEFAINGYKVKNTRDDKVIIEW